LWLSWAESQTILSLSSPEFESYCWSEVLDFPYLDAAE
jgi:hypothetical protein